MNLNWIERFWAKVQRGEPDDCWLWTAGRTGSEYGAFCMEHGVQKKATHVMWFLTHGYWPTEFICHRCDNPPCVNPNHLFEGDGFVNMQDAALKQRCAFSNKRGEDHPVAKLTNEQAKSIREEYSNRKVNGCTMNSIGKQYGMTGGAIWHIVHNKTYRAKT